MLGSAHIYEKPAFAATELVRDLKAMSAGEDIGVEIVGLCTDICVVANALLIKAEMPETVITVDAACCAGTTPERHAAALDTMRSCQIIITNG